MGVAKLIYSAGQGFKKSPESEAMLTTVCLAPLWPIFPQQVSNIHLNDLTVFRIMLTTEAISVMNNYQCYKYKENLAA